MSLIAKLWGVKRGIKQIGAEVEAFAPTSSSCNDRSVISNYIYGSRAFIRYIVSPNIYREREVNYIGKHHVPLSLSLVVACEFAALDVPLAYTTHIYIYSRDFLRCSALAKHTYTLAARDSLGALSYIYMYIAAWKSVLCFSRDITVAGWREARKNI